MASPAKRVSAEKRTTTPRVVVATSYILNFKLPTGVQDDQNSYYSNSNYSWRIKKTAIPALIKVLNQVQTELENLKAL